MNNQAGSEIELEILISTMNRNSLEFLNNMFPNNEQENLFLLIINQTSEEHLLTSDFPNIRVINSFDKGLSKSRNLALENALGRICLLADDDVIYLKGFLDNIIEAFKNHENASLITFKTQTTNGNSYWNYPKSITPINAIYRKVLSIEIAFRKKAIINHNIKFDELFGLGSTFEDGENVFFLRQVLSEKIIALFVPEFIVIHKPYSSSDDVTSDKHFFARGAMNYKLYGFWAYFLLLKLIVSLLRKRLITFADVKNKFEIGLNGIRRYRQINSY